LAASTMSSGPWFMPITLPSGTFVGASEG
jgi:hypothetical protein